MAAQGCFVRLAAVAILVLVIIGSHDVYGRGGRGGGGRGGGGRYGGSSSRGGVRTGGSTSRARYYRGPSYKPSYWGTGMAVGYLYGVSSYQRRRVYRNNPSKRPTVCYNEKNLKNGTYGYFICPMPMQSDDYTYCCGDEDEQRCCKYFDDGGRVAGVVIGVLAFCVVVGICIYCFCTRCRGRKQQRGKVLHQQKDTHDYRNHSGTATGASRNDIPLPTTNTFSVQPDHGGMKEPQGYDTGATGLPYNPNPPIGDQAPLYTPPEPYNPPQWGGLSDDAKAPLPPADVNTGANGNDPYRAPPGIGFTFNDHPNTQPPNYGEGQGQQYPATAPPAYPGN